jgi:hypothetical protein
MLNDPITQDTLVLEYLKVVALDYLPAEVVANMDVSTYWHPVMDSLVVGLSTKILCDTLDDREEVLSLKVPATWWQHTKLVHFPTFSRWLRRPVRYKTLEKRVSVRSLATFPENSLRYPPSLGRVYLHHEVSSTGQVWKNPTTEG